MDTREDKGNFLKVQEGNDAEVQTVTDTLSLLGLYLYWFGLVTFCFFNKWWICKMCLLIFCKALKQHHVLGYFWKCEVFAALCQVSGDDVKTTCKTYSIQNQGMWINLTICLFAIKRHVNVQIWICAFNSRVNSIFWLFNLFWEFNQS